MAKTKWLIFSIQNGLRTLKPSLTIKKIPGLEREMTLGEAIDLKLIDHTQTIVKSRKSNRYISLYQAIKSECVIDSLTGMYANSMNLLEARSKGYLLSIDAMVGD